MEDDQYTPSYEGYDPFEKIPRKEDEDDLNTASYTAYDPFEIVSTPNGYKLVGTGDNGSIKSTTITAQKKKQQSICISCNKVYYTIDGWGTAYCSFKCEQKDLPKAKNTTNTAKKEKRSRKAKSSRKNNRPKTVYERKKNNQQ